MRARRAGTPSRRIEGGETRRQHARRGPGAVGNSRIVAYRARSPARSAAEGHARIPQFNECSPDEPEAAISTRELIELATPRERAILVGAPRKSEPAQVTDEHLEELERLADTAGVEVVGSLVQRVDKPNPRTYIGEGKAEELKGQVALDGATLVIFDDELSPAQGRNLEKEVGTRVMD